MVDRSGLTRLELHYYTVVVAGIPDDSPPADGGVDPRTSEEWALYGSPTPAFPSTAELALAKERSNMRWEEILRQVSIELAPVYLIDVTTNATEDAAGTHIEFTVVYDRREYLRTEDELTPGTFLNGNVFDDTVSGDATDVITRYVARALTTDVVQNRNVYTPDSPNDGDPFQYFEVTAGAPFASIAAAELTIIVTEVANTSPTFPAVP